MDSALDWNEPGAWQKLSEVARRVGDERNLRMDIAGDWLSGERGRTLYLGSRSSSVFARLYEKGKEQLAKGNDEAPADWVRLELVYRPKGRPAREAASHLSPLDMWGVALWSRSLLDAVSGVKVARAALSAYQPGDDERALRALVRQYGATLERLRDRLGSDEAVGKWIMRKIAARAA